MWSFYNPTKIYFGEGEFENLPKYLNEISSQKAFVVCSPFTVRTGLIDELIALAPDRIAGYCDAVEPNPTIQNVDTCVAKAKEAGADCIITIGGGSIMDCAKAVAVGIAMERTGAQILANESPITAALPLIALPTTSGTASEVTAVTVLSDKEKGIKKPIASPLMFPRIAVIDPQLTVSCPPGLTAASGLDALMHALDALSSTKSNPAADALAIQSAKLVFNNLRRAYRDGSNMIARKNMAAASVLAGLAFSQTGTTGSHGCSYVLTTHYGMAHGTACAFTGDQWYLIKSNARPELNIFASEFGLADSEGVARRINQLKREFEMPCTLAEAGIPVEDIPFIVESCMATANMSINIAPVTPEVLERMFKNLA